MNPPGNRIVQPAPTSSSMKAFWKFLLLFVALAAGILATGIFYYRMHEKMFRTEVQQTMAGIAELKVDEMVRWRMERIQDAKSFHHNLAFTALVRRFFDNPEDTAAKRQLSDWLNHYSGSHDYTDINLIDPQGIARLILPAGKELADSCTIQIASEALRSGQITIQDFHRHDSDQRIYLSIQVPIIDDLDTNRPLGALVMLIDPEKSLYPLINKWPTPSPSAETLLVRREGNEAVFLNELRFRTNTALNLRVPLDRITMPAVQAALGREHFMEGFDYRGEPVVATVRAIPDSPWLMVARMDKAEVYAPLHKQLWQVVVMISVLLFSAGAGVCLVWRQQRVQFYREEAVSAIKVKESNDLLSLFVRNSPIYTFIKLVTPTESRVMMASDNFREMIGIDGASMVGKTMEELFPADLAAKMTRDDWACVAGGKMLQIEENLNGRIYNTIKFPIHMEGRSFLAGYTIDITERRMTEKETQQSRAAALNIMEDAITERNRAEKAVTDMEESKSLMEAVVEHAPLMVYLKAATDLSFVLFNRAGEEITGHDRKDVLGRTDADFFTPEKAARFMAEEREVLDGKIKIIDETTVEPLITVSKKPRWLHTRKICIRGTDGKAKYLLGVAEDITERRLAAVALEKSNEELKAALQNLQKAQKQMIQQERLSALGQMASGLAHDFNNVLTPIIGFSDILVSDPAALEDLEGAKHMLTMINSAGNDARQIVKRMRAVYKKEDDARYEMVDILKLVESALSMSMPKWKEEMRAKGSIIEIVTDFRPVPQINGNASELRQALTNLIFNATDAMPKGGIITFRVHSEDNISVLLEMTDTGHGMDEVTLQHCMEPFYTTKGPQGSGLGLAMVYGIVVRHGARIDIESKPGAGTTVRIRFSLPVEAKAIDTAQAEETAPLPPMKILVVDDEERSISFLAQALKTDDHQVETADNGKKGLDVLRKGQFDMIITDRAMPVMGGDEFAVEAQKIRPGIPIIMLTGFGDIMKDTGVNPPGISRVMSKPVTWKELRSAMAGVIGKS